MLAQDYKSIYTWPQTTKNQMAFAAVNGKFDLSGPWSMQTGFYMRRFRQKHVDGNDADIEECDAPLDGTLCLDDDGFPGQPAANFQILNRRPPIPFVAGTPYGTVDRTSTDARVYRRLGAVRQRRQALRPRQFVCRRREHRPRPDQVRCQQRAWIYLSRPVRRTERRGAGHRIADPDRRQHRLCPGDAERAQHLLRALCARHLRHHQAAFDHRRRAAQRRADQLWPISSAPAPTSTARTPSAVSIR